MPIHTARDTRAALGGPDVPQCKSRSLLLDRFACPDSRDDRHSSPRKQWFDRLCRLPAASGVPPRVLPPGAIVVRARLVSRLMVNMAGGVMENAGLLLDRFGLPYIPGSAVKGCARRLALAALRQWCETGAKPDGQNDLFRGSCGGFGSSADMLAAICRVFGWVQMDWDSGKREDHWRSDLFWACNGNLKVVEAAALALGGVRQGDSPPWKSLPNFRGSVAFLPAHPNSDPGLETDVVTCHHPHYYAGERNKPNATDDEEPNPVLFVAVRPQQPGGFFAFPLVALGAESGDAVKLARTWLAAGLETFGIGAKGNAGYGAFEETDESGRPLRTSDPERPSSNEALREPPAAAAAAGKHPLVAEWAGQLNTTGNFRVALPKIAAIADTDELRRVFEAVIPLEERQQMRRKNRYWQAFESHAPGKAILKRLQIELS